MNKSTIRLLGILGIATLLLVGVLVSRGLGGGVVAGSAQAQATDLGGKITTRLNAVKQVNYEVLQKYTNTDLSDSNKVYGNIPVKVGPLQRVNPFAPF